MEIINIGITIVLGVLLGEFVIRRLIDLYLEILEKFYK